MLEKDILLAIMQSDLALAGLILVFAGFMVSKGGSYETKLGDKYQYLALASAIPISTAMISAWACVDALEGNHWFASTLFFFRIVLVTTGLYVAVSGWMLRP